jgi:hypothetical protein
MLNQTVFILKIELRNNGGLLNTKKNHHFENKFASNIKTLL